ncbi:TPA: tyrosine-type recombinase/integrase [Photobacterium damselae]
MGRSKRTIPMEFGQGDYCYVNITVERKPVAEFIIDEITGELEPRIKKRENPVLITFPALFDGKGKNVFTANIFLRSLALSNLDLSTLDTHARALLLFFRWMKLEAKTIYDCSDDQENGVVYLFRDFLVENLRRDKLNEDNELTHEGSYAPSTCQTYIGTIIRFFEFMHAERIIRFSNDFVPFEYRSIRVTAKSRHNQDDLLGHVKPSDRRQLVVSTNDLSKPFGRKQKIANHHSLSPMREDEKRIFIDHIINNEICYSHAEYVKNLMLYTAIETGLRVEELCTFPLSEIRFPSTNEDEVSVTISEVKNGCLTKYDKERTIKVPSYLMDMLVKYKTSKERETIKVRTVLKHNSLFVNPRGGYPFSTNTIKTYFSKIRKEIRNSHSDWYFTVHDLRSTFATHWLYKRHEETGQIFDVLLDDLKDLMGHDSTETTKKYIRYMDSKKYWLEFANRKNIFISDIME